MSLLFALSYGLLTAGIGDEGRYGEKKLQTLQANQLIALTRDDAPESVKTGNMALPKLGSPDPSGGSLDFQDWLL